VEAPNVSVLHWPAGLDIDQAHLPVLGPAQHLAQRSLLANRSTSATMKSIAQPQLAPSAVAPPRGPTVNACASPYARSSPLQIQPVGAFSMHLMAASSEQHMGPPVAVARLLPSQLQPFFPQRHVVVSSRPIPIAQPLQTRQPIGLGSLRRGSATANAMSPLTPASPSRFFL
jgi:hypothetical protein